jgi:hypothetical protein
MVWPAGILRTLGAAVLLALCAVAAAAPSASAHVPLLEPDRPSDEVARREAPFPGAVTIPDAAVSRAVYGTLADDAAFDAWILEVSLPSSTPVEMLVPKAGKYEAFRPSFAVVGPGLASSGEVPEFIAERLATAYGSGSEPPAATTGVIVVADPGATPRATFYEPFSFTRYFEGGKTRVDLQPGTVYYLIVYDPAGGQGEYALGVGEAEQFTARDAAASVVAVARLKLGLYGQGAFSWRATVVIAVAVLVLASVIVYLVRRRRRRSWTTDPDDPL